MIDRKTVIKAAFSAGTSAPSEARPDRVSSGAVRAMGLSLGRLGEDAARVEQLERQLAASDTIKELDAALIEPSFVDDRLARNADQEFRRLVESIRNSGQQVPILVRPHPDQAERYQVAYGHRRLSACAELGRPVRAVVQQLSDAELVTAQGKENAERRNLSFIERSLFAAGLQAKGFERATIQAALAVHPAEMTRLLAVARSLPISVAAAIGPAPRAGRPRWMELAALCDNQDNRERLSTLLADTAVQAMSSDNRFAFILDTLRGLAAPAGETDAIADPDGRPVIRVERHDAGVRLTVDERAQPGLGEHLLTLLPGIVGAFADSVRKRSDKPLNEGEGSALDRGPPV